jgi:apoptosis-inducing factor 3
VVKEHVVATIGDLKNGQMKAVTVDDQPILLLRWNDEIRAYHGECPHHGAPLDEGTLHKGHVRCPWHQAVFDALTGQVTEPPALDSLIRYEVRVDGEDVIVKRPDTEPEPTMARPVSGKSEPTCCVIVGAGAAGLCAAEQMRRAGFTGRVVILTKEEHLPYDRTELSKTYLADPDATAPLLRSQEFFNTHGIEVRTGFEAVSVDLNDRMLYSSTDDELRYDRLLLALGSTPRQLAVPGEDLDHVHVLRSLNDCDRIREQAATASTAVVVGAGFIAMEAASALASRGISVTVVAPESVPFGATLGDDVGRIIRELHEDNEVTFMLGEKIKGFEIDGASKRVALESGPRIEADIAVVGVGVQPAGLSLTGLNPERDGSLQVGKDLQLVEDVYVAGDLASFPDWRTGETIHIEHWRLAQQHGQVAGLNMAGKPTSFQGVPFFWTRHHGSSFQYVGHATQWDELVIDGNLSERDFVGLYVREGGVFAAVGCGRNAAMGRIAELIHDQGIPDVDAVRAQW